MQNSYCDHRNFDSVNTYTYNLSVSFKILTRYNMLFLNIDAYLKGSGPVYR
jgi:hypothetical protein